MKLLNSIVCSMNFVRLITDAVLGDQVTVGERCILEHCILLGSDKNREHDSRGQERYTTRIGKRAKLSHVILDKNVWIGKDVNISPFNGTPKQREKILKRIGLKPYRENSDGIAEGDFCIEQDSGILVLGRQCEADPKEAILPDGLKC